MLVTGVLVHADALESTVSDLMLEGELVLSVEVIPDFDPTVFSDDKEDALTGWGPAAV